MPISLDEQLGDRHFQDFLPAEQIGDSQIAIILLLTADDRQIQAEPSGDVPQRDPLLLPHVGQPVEAFAAMPRGPW